MPFKNLTPEQKEMDKLVKALNTKIKKIHEAFGTDSRSYQQIYEILSGFNAAGKRTNRFSVLSAGFTREDESGLIQISRSSKALANLEIKQYLKALKRVAQLPSAATIKKNIVNAYIEEHTTTDPKTGKKKKPKLKKADKAQIVKEAMEKDRSMAKRLEKTLETFYALQRKYGYEFRALQDIKALSRGRFTSAEDLEKMIQIAEDTIRNEDKQIQADLFAGY